MKGVLESNHTGESYSTTSTGEESELDFRKSHGSLAVVGTHAVGTRQGKFQAPSKSRTMNGSNSRNFKAGNTLKHVLCTPSCLFSGLTTRVGVQGMDVGTSNETILFPTHDDSDKNLAGFDQAFQLLHDTVKVKGHSLVKHIYRGLFAVENDPSDHGLDNERRVLSGEHHRWVLQGV